MENIGEELIVKPKDIENSISTFNEPLNNYLAFLGLPTENILYPMSERKKVINSLESAIDILPYENREKAYYLTKFTVSIAVGLFDSALNFLWNETIKALRKMIEEYDEQHFFSVLEKISGKYKNSYNFEEISDHDMLEACRRIGLISEVIHKKLEHINYMRNHASAAHPNDNEFNGFEILGWLEDCIKYAILAKPDHSAITVKKLLGNIRMESIPDEDICVIGNEICKLPQERIDDLLWSIFGMYIDSKLNVESKKNINKLCGYMWDASSENRKYEIGARFGLFRKNAEVSKRNSAEEFLTIVKGLKYKDEDSLSAELLDKLSMLKSAHFGMNNFYNEYPCVVSIDSSIPPNGIIPISARTLFVKVILVCAIGNGNGYRDGVDESAMEYYNKYIENFSEKEIVEFLYLMSDTEFTTDFDRNKPEKRLKKLCEYFKEKFENVFIKKALDIIISCHSGIIYKIHSSTEYKNILSKIPLVKA